jgi:type IV pilus assembly protein PilA
MLHGFVKSHRGFTLIEMMAVVIIIGVLATLAVFGVRKYIFASKTAEAIHMIGSIKSAEEAYRGETFVYAGSSVGIDSVLYYPQGKDPGQYKTDWTNTDHEDYAKVWGPLGVVSDSPVIFGYAIEAGNGTKLDSPPKHCTGVSWGSRGDDNTGPWYIVKAEADQNGDGKFSCFTSCNLTGDIFSVNDDE